MDFSGIAPKYRAHLKSEETFAHWTLESVVETIRRFTSDPWIDEFHDRYLNFAKIDRMLQ